MPTSSARPKQSQTKTPKRLRFDLPDELKPALYSPSLNLQDPEDFPSDADWLIPLMEAVLVDAAGEPLKLDLWQKWLLKHILERFPEGHPRAGELRYRQGFMSVARQNGKSLLGSIMGFYGLLRKAGTPVLGLATSREQAGVIYDAMHRAITAPGSKLAPFFSRTTETRGLKTKQGSTYVVKPAKESALQGKSAAVTNVDELHILLQAIWDAAVNGNKAQKNGIVWGFTTAGDDDSKLLLNLYDRVAQEISQRFGWFIWQAEEAEVPEDEETLIRYVKQANPAVACGRIDIENALEDLKGKPAPDVIRYALNRFVGSTNVFIPAADWMACGGDISDAPIYNPVIAIDRTSDWSHASFVAAWRGPDGKNYTELIASVANPTIEKLVDVCMELYAFSPRKYVVEGMSLKSLIIELRNRGIQNASWSSLGDFLSASSFFYKQIKDKSLSHPSDPLLTSQIPRVQRKNVGDQYKLSRGESGADIDAVIATAIAIYALETTPENSIQVHT